MLDVDEGGAGAVPGDERERLQEHRRGGDLGGDGGDVALGGHEATAGVVEGGVAGADGAAGTVERFLGGGEAHAGVRLRSGCVAVVVNADREVAGGGFGGDAERVEQPRQRRRDARARTHEHGEGEGFEGHAALR